MGIGVGTDKIVDAVGSGIGLIRSSMQLVTESEDPESSRKDPVVELSVVESIVVVVAAIE